MQKKYCEKRFHKYYEFILCLCMIGQSNKAFDEKS